MKICVIGGAGYIGSHAVYALVDAGHDVVVIDNLSTGTAEFVHPKAKFYWGDITDTQALDELFSAISETRPIDAVMHFAAKIVVPESVADPNSYYYNNVEGVRIMLDVLVRHGIKNVVFSSTAAVYGDVKKDICLETDLLAPINPYGETKLASEKMIQWFAQAYDLNYCIFRYFNVAGAHESLKIGLKSDKLTHIIPVVVETALGIRPKMTVFGNDYDTPDGTCIRDYIHVADLADAHVLGVEYIAANKTSQIINLGSSKGFSVQEIINVVEEKYPVHYDFGPRREGDPAKLIASSAKAQEILGWRPRYDLKAIVFSDLDFRIQKK